MTCEVTIIEDSINPYNGIRLTTMQLKYWRAFHSEFMTHRVFCLDGDSILEFDLPGGRDRKYKRVYQMKLSEFVDKWFNGAKTHKTSRFLDKDVSILNDDEIYTARNIAELLGYKSCSNIRSYCRKKKIVVENPYKCRREDYLIKGSSFKSFYENTGERRLSMRQRLSRMRIRQCNESDKTIQTSRVVNCCFSGVKPVFKLQAGSYSVNASKDHQFLTSDGWKRLEDITPGVDSIFCTQFGKQEADKTNPQRYTTIDGKSKAQFNKRHKSSIIQDQNGICLDCGSDITTKCDIHHVIPVNEDTTLAFDVSNIIGLCPSCHKKRHTIQGWQGGTYLYATPVMVDSIDLVGEKDTYDLEIEGEFPNFIANGIVTHNSRSASSSRAIPVEKNIKNIWNNPAGPSFWGENKSGMQSDKELSGIKASIAKGAWDLTGKLVCGIAWGLNKTIHPHKQVLNRMLEPWQYISVIVTATEWENFFNLRDHKDAQPEFKVLAGAMRAAKNASIATERLMHLPYVTMEERDTMTPEVAFKVSTARCARVSYLLHDGNVPTLAKDLELYNRLVGSTPIHASPAEHCAWAINYTGFNRNFRGWEQHRVTVEENLAVLGA